MAEFDYKEYAKQMRENCVKDHNGNIICSPELWEQVASIVENTPTADVTEVETVSEKIIRKKAEIHDYWIKDVKQYRTMQGYSDIEHDVDNFLRGYNEAVDDILDILDGKDGAE